MPGGVTTEVPKAVRTYQMYIDGEWVASKSGKTFPVYDPSTEDVIAQVPEANADDVNRAVSAAKAAFDEGPWASTTAQERGRVLFRLSEKIRANLAELAELECRNTGKPIVEAEFDINDAATCFEYYGGLATKVVGYVNPVPDNAMSLSLKEPVGVAGQIIPWNYPLLMAAWKLAPAIAAGCACVLKPAEQTPLTALRLAELCDQAGLPPGVLNVLTGFGETAGAALAHSDNVDKVCFTGSAEVGKKIVEAAAGNLKRVTLELGGKSPNVIFADTDLESAIPAAAQAIFHNTGQVCCAGSRLYVEKNVFDRVVEGVAERAKSIKLGAAFNSESEIGPLMSEVQLNRVQSYVQDGAKNGAKILAGGKQVGERGYFYEPTVLLNTTPAMSVEREEIFGPVVCAIPFGSTEEIPAVANQTLYGLAASIWTRDISKALRLAKALNAGAVWVNCFNVFDPNLPWGGFKQSGWGRELGQEGVEAFTELKAVTIKL